MVHCTDTIAPIALLRRDRALRTLADKAATATAGR
jgi:hypothetical protein